MYWVIFLNPDSPSFCSFSRLGTTTVISCRMIDAVMYGMIPSANSERFESAPPEKMLSRPNRLFPPAPPPKKSFSARVSTPGAGRYEPSR